MRRDRIKFSLLVFALAILLRVFAIAPLVGTPLLDTIMGDALNYEPWARAIAAGDWLGDEIFYQAPLYPYFLGLIFRLFGPDLLVVRGVQIVLGSASCALLVLAGWRWFSKSAGIVAGVMLAVYAPAIFADLTIQKSVLDLFFVCLILWCMAALAERPRRAGCMGLGAALGLLVLSRENALVFAPVLGLWLGVLPAALRGERAARPALFSLGIALVLLPVAGRNAYVGGEFHLTTSQFGHNFYIGNNPSADGSYRPLIARRADPRIERRDAIELAERASGRRLTPAEVSSFYTRRALDYIRAQPLDWIRLIARKLALASNAVEWVDTKDLYSFAARSRPLWLFDRFFHFGVLAPLALLGLLIHWPERRRLWPLPALYLAYTATLLVFYVFGRYRLPTIPIAVLFAASGAIGARRWFARSTPKERAGVLVATLALALFCNWPLASRARMRSVTQYNLGNWLAADERVDEAVSHYREAIRLFEGNARAHQNLGSLLASRGDLGPALRHFERAIAIDAGYAQAHFNRARVLRERGAFEAAIASYERGLRAEPGNSEARLELALFELEIGRPAAALPRLEQVLSSDSSNAVARDALRRARAILARAKPRAPARDDTR